MSIVCTFPGKFGDLLWALPTVRAIARRIGEPVHLRVGCKLASIVPLLQLQPYLASVKAYLDWTTFDTAPISPRVPPDRDHYPGTIVLNLGYRDWPIPDVAIHTRLTATMEGQAAGILEYPLDLTEWSFEPWISVPGEGIPGHWQWPWVYGFTDEHFELKYGLVQLLEQKPHWWKGERSLFPTTIGGNPRWQAEAGYTPTNWIDSAMMLRYASVFLGDCSALHVLAVAMGVPAVLMEPNPHRHNQVFYPLGTEGPRVYLVNGVDGKPTFDARHVRDTLDKVLAARLSVGVDSPPPQER